MTGTTPPTIRLLVVDDDVRFADYLRILLARARTVFEIDMVDSVADALRELSRARHHVCLLDYRLGTEDGLDVLRRAHARGLRTPIILLTGERDESLEFTALEEGAADYLNKSEMDPRRLERIICRALARHRADMALRERETRLAHAEAFTLVMPAHIALDGQWLKVPPRLCDLLGYTEDELLGLRFQDVTHPDDLAQHVELRRRLIEGSARSIEIEKRYVRKDGSILWTYQNCALVSREDGAPLYYLTYLRDISDQKRAEDERKGLEEQLRQSQKMEAIGQLAGGVAHDFNNLLTAILGYTELLQEACGGMPRITADLEEIHGAGKSAAALTEQLLAFSRKQVVQPEVVSVNDVIDGMRNLLGRLLGEDITLTTALDPGVPSIEVDPVQLQQVILNLAANARDAMPRGGRLLIQTSGVEPVSAPPVIAGSRPERRVAVTVTDTGCGMDGATQARIFEPFFTTKALGKGTGLGLSTVYGIVKQAGGDIVCESTPAAGTKFTILLPATDKAGSQSTAPTPCALAGSGTVLLVEDQAIVRRLTRRILETHGYRVVDTGDPDIALSIAAGSPIDLLLTDVVMPDMSGPELVREIRSIGRAMPVLFMSGFAGHSALSDISGAPFIHKPFTPGSLVAMVGQVLKQRPDADRLAPAS